VQPHDLSSVDWSKFRGQLREAVQAADQQDPSRWHRRSVGSRQLRPDAQASQGQRQESSERRLDFRRDPVRQAEAPLRPRRLSEERQQGPQEALTRDRLPRFLVLTQPRSGAF